MAQARGKSGSRSRPRTTGRKRSSSRKSGGGGLWPWVAALVVVGGGIALYENSADARRFANGLMPGSKTEVASAKPRPARPSSPSSTVPTPAPLRHSVVAPPPAPPEPVRQTAMLMPPAPLLKPQASDKRLSDETRSDPGVAGAYQAKFFLCGTAKQDDCVLAGDRFVFHGQKIRLVGIEVPDIKKPRCEAERIKASDAELRVRAFLDSGPFELVSWQGNDQETDGHKLRAVMRNGRSLADILVNEGLARKPGSSGGWC